MKSLRHIVLWVIIFSIAMGYLEAAVVVYLREIYYPAGFAFPLQAISTRDMLVESVREAATMIMLAGVAMLSGKTRMQRFAFFLLSFGVWDLFYYAFLKLMLGWPVSWLTWDILFLLSVCWMGPVLAPCILSVTMIWLAAVVLHKEKKYGKVFFPVLPTVCIPAGACTVIASFCEDPLRHLSAFMGSNPAYMPGYFLWWLFIAGEIMIIFRIYKLYRGQPGKS